MTKSSDDVTPATKPAHWRTEGMSPTTGRWRYASAAAWLRLAIP